jgi:outer membrane protein assembly factor BamD (BamD/ComL family)
VSFIGEGQGRRPVQVQVPPEVLEAISARDEYNRRIDYALDPQKNGLLYAFQSAEFYFVYGQFEEAEKRLEPIMDRFCGVNEWGYRAWEKLVSMSNFQGDATRSRQLVEGRSCAFDEETRAAEDAIRTPVRQGVAYLDARQLYDAAEKLPEGAERDAKWRDAAAAYKVALDAAPDRDEAPEAAMNGAFAYKQVGEYDKAIEMYALFIERYGNEEKLNVLRSGDPAATPVVAPEPGKYESRAKFLKMAYDALANAYVLFFDYPKAAQTFDTISKVSHFSQTQRKESAQQAMNLYASLGDSRGMRVGRDNFVQQGASAKEVAEADYVIAASSLKEWDQFSADTGGNEAARKRAELAMRQYFDTNRDRPEAAEYVIEAAYWVAKMKAAGKDGLERTWWEQTMAAFDRYRRSAPPAEDGTNSAIGSRQATMAAEGAYTLLDEEVRAKFDYEAGHQRFKGTPQEVLASYQKAAQEAKAWFDKFKAQVEYYGSPEWGTAAVARQGAIYDSLRTGLYNVRAPELKMFDKKTEQILERAEQSDNLELQEKADALRIRVEDGWRDARDRELAGADTIMVDRYASAMTMARRYNISNPAVVRAIQRLAFFTDVIGEAKLTQYTSRVGDLGYSEGLFLRMRPGLVTAPSNSGLPKAVPLSAGPP